MMKLIPTLQSQNVKRFGRQGMEFQPTYTPPTPKPGSGTKGTKGKGGAKPKGKGKTTNTPTTDPDTSTSEMKDTGKKSGKTPSGKKPGAKSSSKEIATAGFTGSNRYKDTPEEAFDINKRAGLNPTTGPGSVPPKAKKTAKPKKPSTPKNGNSGSTNGNKKGGM
jgi:hypothetical protein